MKCLPFHELVICTCGLCMICTFHCMKCFVVFCYLNLLVQLFCSFMHYVGPICHGLVLWYVVWLVLTRKIFSIMRHKVVIIYSTHRRIIQIGNAGKTDWSTCTGKTFMQNVSYMPRTGTMAHCLACIDA